MQKLCVGKTSKKRGAGFLKHMFWQISAFSEFLPTLFLESERKHMKKTWIFLGPLCNRELLTHLLSTIPTTFPCHKNDNVHGGTGLLRVAPPTQKLNNHYYPPDEKERLQFYWPHSFLKILKIFCTLLLTNTFCLALTLSSYSEPNCNSTRP